MGSTSGKWLGNLVHFFGSSLFLVIGESITFVDTVHPLYSRIFDREQLSYRGSNRFLCTLARMYIV